MGIGFRVRAGLDRGVVDLHKAQSATAPHMKTPNLKPLYSDLRASECLAPQVQLRPSRQKKLLSRLQMSQITIRNAFSSRLQALYSFGFRYFVSVCFPGCLHHAFPVGPCYSQNSSDNQVATVSPDAEQIPCIQGFVILHHSLRFRH